MVCPNVDGGEKLLVVPCIEIEMSKLDVATMVFGLPAVVDSCMVLMTSVDFTLVEVVVIVEGGGVEVVGSVL